jgi:UDP-GlcNAc3NAcA epimerase
VKILTIVGARPQFIKASVVSRAIAAEAQLHERVVHTGQHFDANMSDVFFGQLGLPRPDHELKISGGGHGEMTGRMLAALEKVIMTERPDRVLVYGDTNSTLAGALAAVKLHVPVAHVEAGLRSFNMRMPEEINRILTDQVSDVLYCPTDIALQNLADEGFTRKPAEVLKVGDVMQDSALFFAEFAKAPDCRTLDDGFILATLHRAENTDDRVRLAAILDAINQLHREAAPVILPLHPRTRNVITRFGLELDAQVVDPVGYLEMLWLLQRSELVLTDSGGLQKESFFFGKPCVTMRDQTEWLELVTLGANRLAGANTDRIVEAARDSIGLTIEDNEQIYGGGKASLRIAKHLSNLAGQ